MNQIMPKCLGNQDHEPANESQLIMYDSDTLQSFDSMINYLFKINRHLSHIAS